MTTNWSDAELEASVRSYLEMKDKELKGIKFTKVDYYRDLSKKFGRSEKSFEYSLDVSLWDNGYNTPSFTPKRLRGLSNFDKSTSKSRICIPEKGTTSIT